MSESLILVEIIEALDSRLQGAIEKGRYFWGSREAFMKGALGEVYKADPGAFTFPQREMILDNEKRNIGFPVFSHSRYESHYWFRGDADRIAQALRQCFDSAARPLEVEVSKQLGLSQDARDKFASDDPNVKIDSFVLTVRNGLYAYNLTRGWEPPPSF